MEYYANQSTESSSVEKETVKPINDSRYELDMDQLAIKTSPKRDNDQLKSVNVDNPAI